MDFKLPFTSIIAVILIFLGATAFSEGSRKPSAGLSKAASPPAKSNTIQVPEEEEGEYEEEGEEEVQPVVKGRAVQPLTQRSPASQTPAAQVVKKSTPQPSDEVEAEGEEEEEDEGEAAEAKDQENPAAREKMVERLLSKLTLPTKRLASIVFLQPVTFVDGAISEVVLASMQKFMGRYGSFNISVKNNKLASLSLEGFRGIMGKIKADVVFATVLKPTHFDLFIFDRRTPYYVFYHSEVHPEERSGPVKVTETVAIEQTKILMRRALYLYLTNQFYELPRSNNADVVMDSQIPRWMASASTVEGVNSAMSRDFYTAASLGGAITSAGEGRTWAGGVLGFQLGSRIYGPTFFEIAYQAFAYHAVMGVIRYNISNKYSALQILPGLGGGVLTGRKSIDIDRNLTLHKDYGYLVPSIAFWLPLGELYFKAETMMQISLKGDKFVFHFVPGLLVQF